MTLLLHTATATAHIGIADGSRLIAQEAFPVDRQFAERLTGHVREFLRTHRSGPAALRNIVVHAGPGGFSSLRIGVTTANALAYALGIPVVGVTGDVPDLAALLTKGQCTQPASQNLVLPVYAQEPNIGPVPGRI